jgi:hypothetical protein
VNPPRIEIREVQRDGRAAVFSLLAEPITLVLRSWPRQLRFQDNPAWQAGLDFNALDHSVLCTIEPGHEPTEIIAEHEISQCQFSPRAVISIELRIDDYHGGGIVDWLTIPEKKNFDLAVVYVLQEPDERPSRR